MRYDPEIHCRRSIRLKGYDYAVNGGYFVTICSSQRECLFGEVVGGAMVLNPAGEMVRSVWEELPTRFPNVVLGGFIAMPNHFHGILFLTKSTDVGAPLVGAQGFGHSRTNRAGTRPAPTIGDIIGVFKSQTTVECIRGVEQHGWPPFPGRLWQRNYYERVLRNDDELTRARRYILENPLRWEMDKENPANIP